MNTHFRISRTEPIQVSKELTEYLNRHGKANVPYGDYVSSICGTKHSKSRFMRIELDRHHAIVIPHSKDEALFFENQSERRQILKAVANWRSERDEKPAI